MANIARRLMLNLPICLDDKEHRDRGDGFCNCGYEMPGTPVKRKLTGREWHLPRPRTNLDIIEKNEGNR